MTLYKPEVRVEVTFWVHANGSLLCGTDTADIVSISLQDASLNEVVSHSQMLDAIRPLIEYDKALGTVEAIGILNSLRHCVHWPPLSRALEIILRPW